MLLYNTKAKNSDNVKKYQTGEDTESFKSLPWALP